MRLQHVFYIIILLTFFVGSNVLNNIGWRIGAPGSPSYQQILPQFYLAAILIGLKKMSSWKYNKMELNILMTIFGLTFFMIIGGNTGMLNSIPNGLLLPAMISALIIKNSSKQKANLRIIIVFFFVANCSMAIFERLITTNTFPFTQTIDRIDIMETSFRSTALQNHPLNNALIISTILSIFLVTQYHIKRYNLIFLILAFLTLLSFNTRSSITLWGIIISILLVQAIFSYKTKTHIKLLLTLVACLGTVGLYYILFIQGWGNRLTETNVGTDDSIASRFDALNIFSIYNVSDFLFGTSKAGFTKIMTSMSLAHVENFWIIYIIRYGIIWTAIFTTLYIKLILKIYQPYNKKAKLFVLGIFLILCSSNNSLAFSEQPLSILIICGYAFAPSTIERNRQKKHDTVLYNTSL